MEPGRRRPRRTAPDAPTASPPYLPSRSAAPAAEAHPDDPHHEALLDLIGVKVAERYTLTSIVGRGGMGAVYVARDGSGGGDVALKLLHDEETGSGRAALRFRREYHTLVSLDHPRIVKTFDYGRDRHGVFYTMELLDGQDLKNVGTLPHREVCALLRDVAAALATLHARSLVHRDLGPRNVRRTSDGRAKLFDFGVLVNVGMPGEVAGTPSTMAPENARGLPVDGRTDLYSLGALAYMMLTGRSPYPSRNIEQLEHAWRTPPPPPSKLAPDVPRALDELVMSAIALDPLARPASAGAIIDRLTTIAALPPLPASEVRRGYLASAAIVGRTRELEIARGVIASTREGSGAVLFVDAESGTGKSRLLREIAIEAKLDGAVVLEAACESAPPSPFGTLSQLVDHAMVIAPESARRSAAAHARVLSRRFPHLGLRTSDMGTVALEPAEERLRVQAAMSGWLRSWAEQAPLCVLVDDVQRADEASAAVLAALANDLREVPLTLVVARRTGEPTRAGVAVDSLARRGARIRLSGLRTEDIEDLVRSFFGDVPNVGRLAQVLHTRAHGSPLHTTELVRALVESEVIRYVDGSWTIPSETSAIQTGRHATLEGTLDQRILRLGPDALAAAEVLGVAGGQRPVELLLTVLRDDAPGFTEARLFSALDELGREGIVMGDGLGYRFRHDGLREAVLRSLALARRKRLSLSLAEEMARHLVDDPGREAEVGWHFVQSGELDRGAYHLARAGHRLYEAQALSDCIAPLEKALEIRLARGAPAAETMGLRGMLLAAGWVSDRAVGSRHALAAVEAYRRHCGLDTASRLARWFGPLLGAVLGVAWGTLRWLFRFEALHGRGARGPTPDRAAYLFALAHAYACGLANAENRADDLLELVRMVEPLRAFQGRMPEAVHAIVNAMPDILFGRLHRASERLGLAIEVFRTDRLAPISAVERSFAEAAARGLRVLVNVNQFDARLEEDLAQLDALGFRYYRLVAQATRAVKHRYRGEESLARAIERAMEPESLALGSWSTDVQVLYFAHPAYALTNDVDGLKRSLEELERLVAQGFRIEARVTCTRADLLRSRGEPERACELLREAVRDISPRDFLMRQWMTSSLAEAELAAGRPDPALDACASVLAVGDAEPEASIVIPRLRVARIRGLALLALGRTKEATSVLMPALALAESLDIPSLAGLLHEARARVALTEQDSMSYLLHCAEADRHLRPTQNPSLIASLERLVASAETSAPAEPPTSAGTSRDDVTLAQGSRSHAPR